MFVRDINNHKSPLLTSQRTHDAPECFLLAKLHNANEQIFREKVARLQVEAELEKSLSLLQATLESTAEGVIAINSKGHIVSFNQKFVQMWQIPESIMKSHNHNQCLTFYNNQLNEPETFCKRIQELDSQVDVKGYDTLKLKDGRVFEQYYQPLQLGEQIIGTVWSFRDITDRFHVEKGIHQNLAQEEQPAADPTLPADSQSIFSVCPQLKEVFDFIEANYEQSINLNDVAQAVNYAPAYLTDLVRRLTGKTVHQWIVERRMAKACSLLVETNQSIEQIAEAVGYRYVGCFFRQFRISFGTTPQVWRNEKICKG